MFKRNDIMVPVHSDVYCFETTTINCNKLVK